MHFTRRVGFSDSRHDCSIARHVLGCTAHQTMWLFTPWIRFSLPCLSWVNQQYCYCGSGKSSASARLSALHAEIFAAKITKKNWFICICICIIIILFFFFYYYFFFRYMALTYGNERHFWMQSWDMACLPLRVPVDHSGKITKAITLTNHNRRKQCSEAIRVWNSYM